MCIWKQYFLMEYHNLKTFVLLPSWKVALYLPLDISISLLKTLSFPLRVEFLYYRKSPLPPPTPSSCSFHSDAFSHFYLWLLLQSCGICGESLQFSSVQFSGSVVSDSATPWIAARQASLFITSYRSSLRLTTIESVMPSSHLILCRPLLLPPIPLSISLFQEVNSSHEVAKVLEFQL